jgi:hypothetical protein
LTVEIDVPIMRAVATPDALTDNNDEMSVLAPRLDGWIDALVERTQAQLRSELESLTVQLADAVEMQQAEAAREARAEAEAAANAFLTDAIAAERSRAAQLSQTLAGEAEAKAAALQSTVDRLSAEIAELRESAGRLTGEAERQQAAAAEARVQERQADLDVIGALGEACRDFDAAPTLTAMLTALANHAGARVNRCALLVLRAGALRGWAYRGFQDEAAALDVKSSDRTPVARAWQSGVAEVSTPDEIGAHMLSPRSEGRSGMAIPIIVDGQVVAVLYGDDEGDTRQNPGTWPEQLEVLARYAGRCLESLTLRRMPALMRASASARARAQIARHDDESAQRYARLLVAEIKLYNEAALEDARRDADILRRLRPQIERAQALYNERVPAEQRARTTYFDDELVRTLAGGDQALLGQGT